jgi:hypothetical protein
MQPSELKHAMAYAMHSLRHKLRLQIPLHNSYDILDNIAQYDAVSIIPIGISVT